MSNLKTINSVINLLPQDGNVTYFGKIFSYDIANQYYHYLLNHIHWQNDEAYIFGKHFITKRKVAWYANEPYNYTYSKITKQALPWTPELLLLKQTIEAQTGSTYNSCLLNLYHNGQEGMAYHSDDEKTLALHHSIASVSFGIERKFLFKHKYNKETVAIQLEHGSLLEMKDETQTYWWHRLPTSKKILTPRINLTFRKIMI